MFAGNRRRSSNIRVMQLFHELKQQFPTVPDHVVTACIASHAQSPNSAIRDILSAAAALTPQEPMGRSPPPSSSSSSSSSSAQPSPTVIPPPRDFDTATASFERRNEQIMHESDSQHDFNNQKIGSGVAFSKKNESVSVCTEAAKSNSTFFVKRPDKLDLKSEQGEFSHSICLSEKCKDVHKLLNSERVSDKPPRSPITNKKVLKNSPKTPLASPEVIKRLQTSEEPNNVRKKETASTPTQTTDTLLGPPNTLNLSLNLSMDVVQSPTARRCSSLQVTPQQPWLQEPQSPRSYTSVNLTLRPPSSEPQPPIDITSQNSSLTYSTSSFDSQKGLQSRLQITVGPGGGSVSATRTRPRSSYMPEEEKVGEMLSYKAGSLTDLSMASEPPVILKQQARIERLKIELRTEKTRLEVMQAEVSDLEMNSIEPKKYKVDIEMEKQLRKEIKHLQYQCEQLVLQTDAPINIQEDFYQNIYTGQRGPLNVDTTSTPIRRFENYFNRSPPTSFNFQANEGAKWDCHLCTFLNHPDLDKCEQCEMPRILHVSAAPGDNIHIHVTPRLSRRVVHSWVL